MGLAENVRVAIFVFLLIQLKISRGSRIFTRSIKTGKLEIMYFTFSSKYVDFLMQIFNGLYRVRVGVEARTRTC